MTEDMQNPKLGRKPYQKPQLVVYGNIANLTRATDNQAADTDSVINVAKSVGPGGTP